MDWFVPFDAEKRVNRRISWEAIQTFERNTLIDPDHQCRHYQKVGMVDWLVSGSRRLLAGGIPRGYTYRRRLGFGSKPKGFVH